MKIQLTEEEATAIYQTMTKDTQKRLAILALDGDNKSPKDKLESDSASESSKEKP